MKLTRLMLAGACALVLAGCGGGSDSGDNQVQGASFGTAAPVNPVTWYLRGGVGGLPGMLGLVSTPQSEQWLTLRPGSGSSDQYADYFGTFKGDTFLRAGTEFYVTTLDANGNKVENIAKKPLGGSLDVTVVSTGMVTPDAKAPQWTAFNATEGPGLFYASTVLKTPVREQVYNCESPLVVAAKLGTERLATTALVAPTAQGSASLTLSGANAGAFGQRLRVRFLPTLQVAGATVASAFDSGGISREAGKNHVYDGWDADALERLGYLVVPSEEYFNAQNQSQRDVAVLFKLPTAQGLLHGVLTLTCRR